MRCEKHIEALINDFHMFYIEPMVEYAARESDKNQQQEQTTIQQQQSLWN